MSCRNVHCTREYCCCVNGVCFDTYLRAPTVGAVLSVGCDMPAAVAEDTLDPVDQWVLALLCLL